MNLAYTRLYAARSLPLGVMSRNNRHTHYLRAHTRARAYTYVRPQPVRACAAVSAFGALNRGVLRLDVLLHSLFVTVIQGAVLRRAVHPGGFLRKQGKDFRGR